MTATVLTLPTRQRGRRPARLGARIAATTLIACIGLGQPALSQSRADCTAAEAAVRQRLLPLLRHSDPEIVTAVRSSIATSRVAAAHCRSGRIDRALQLYGQVVTALDPVVAGPDRDLADEFWR